jgi:hypothetical protein
VLSVAEAQAVAAPAEEVERVERREAKGLLEQYGAIILDVSKQANGEKIRAQSGRDPTI